MAPRQDFKRFGGEGMEEGEGEQNRAGQLDLGHMAMLRECGHLAKTAFIKYCTYIQYS
jgi:hypothetical protein